MIILKLKLNNGDIQEIKVQDLLEVDGIPYAGSFRPDSMNHEDRIQLLERGLSNLMNFLDDKFPSPNPQNEES